MRAMSKLLALALTATLQSAMAGTVLLNFEDLTTSAPLTNRYASQGVNISGSAWGATSVVCGGQVGFSRSGSCGALWLVQDPTKTSTNTAKSLTLTLDDGFVDAMSFVYSGRVLSPNLQVHAFDAAGQEVGLGLSGLTGTPCTSGLLFCNWSQTVTLSFTGIARSVTFTAVDATVLLDDLRFTTPAATGRLPEPGSIALALGALGGLAWSRRRAAR